MIQTHVILSTTEYAAEFLKVHPELPVTVHSVYRKTINLTAAGQLLALQIKGSPISPISLLLSQEASEALSRALVPGDVGRTEENGLIFDFPGRSESLRLSITTATHIVDTSLSDQVRLQRPVPAQALSQLLMELLHFHTGESFALLFTDPKRAEENLFLKAATARLHQARQAFREQDPERAAGELIRLLGLGIGLTPGGDDFLCGMLAGSFLTGTQNSVFARLLQGSIREHLDRTHEISRAFLLCALEGRYSEAVCQLCKTLQTNQTEPLEQSGACAPETGSQLAQRFLAIGHTSGFDTLAGIYYYAFLLSSGLIAF